MLLGLKRVIQSHNKWVIARGKDFLFSQRSLDFVPLDHLFLA
jgi:hypothetical protein